MLALPRTRRRSWCRPSACGMLNGQKGDVHVQGCVCLPSPRWRMKRGNPNKDVGYAVQQDPHLPVHTTPHAPVDVVGHRRGRRTRNLHAALGVAREQVIDDNEAKRSGVIQSVARCGEVAYGGKEGGLHICVCVCVCVCVGPAESLWSDEGVATPFPHQELCNLLYYNAATFATAGAAAATVMGWTRSFTTPEPVPVHTFCYHLLVLTCGGNQAAIPSPAPRLGTMHRSLQLVT
eukprot:364341-Chlamydomonas_euryale.AAC.3